MSETQDPTVNELAGELSQLRVEQVEAAKPAADSGVSSSADDGYSSSTSASTEDLNDPVPAKKETRPDDEDSDDGNVEEAAPSQPKEADITKRTESTSETEDYDDEKDLEPLVIVSPVKEEASVEFISRGPVSVEQSDHRYNPYGRGNNNQGVITHSNNGTKIPGDDDHCSLFDDCERQPKPVLLIYRKSDPERPVRLEGVHMEWLDQHELRIEKSPLPDDCIFADTNNIQLTVQLNPAVPDTKSFLAHVKKVIKDESGCGNEKYYIGPIVISLKTDLADSQEKILLKSIPEKELDAAKKLVDQKDIMQLTAGMGPHKDTVLSILCANRKSNPGQILAQIYAVIQRLINHQDEAVRHSVFKINNNGISAFEIAAITNNKLVACYLAEVMYNLIDDTRTALKVLNVKDSQGNSIVHLLARKGDCTAATLRGLLSMVLTDGTQLFSVGVNSKRQTPLHIAAQSSTNQPETLKIFWQASPLAFGLPDDDGMTPLHYACQRGHDSALVQAILSYHKDNICQRRKDGLTALDLVMNRPTVEPEDGAEEQFVIEQSVKDEIINLLRNNGGKSGLQDGNSGHEAAFANGSEYPSATSVITNNQLDTHQTNNGCFNGFQNGGGSGNVVERDSPTSPCSPCVQNNMMSSSVGSPYSTGGYSTSSGASSVGVDSPPTLYQEGGLGGSPAPSLASTTSSQYSGGFLGAGSGMPIRAPGSVESYIQSSPESVHGEHQLQIFTSSGGQRSGSHNYYNGPYGWSNNANGQGSPYYDGDSVDGSEYDNSSAIEEHLASQIMNEFPEIHNLMGQILDGNL